MVYFLVLQSTENEHNSTIDTIPCGPFELVHQSWWQFHKKIKHYKSSPAPKFLRHIQYFWTWGRPHMTSRTHGLRGRGYQGLCDNSAKAYVSKDKGRDDWWRGWQKLSKISSRHLWMIPNKAFCGLLVSIWFDIGFRKDLQDLKSQMTLYTLFWSRISTLFWPSNSCVLLYCKIFFTN